MEFGWKPIANDLKKLLDFTALLDARTKEIEALMKSGLRRKRTLAKDGWTETRPTLYTLNREGWQNYQTSEAVAAIEYWGFVNWVHTSAHSLPPIFDPNARNLAIQAILGLTVDANTIWELLPFSWLADWCSNAGGYLAASRNTVGAIPTEILIMSETRIDQKVKLVSVANFAPPPKLVEGSLIYDRHWVIKARTRGMLTVQAHMPFLSERQVLILADVVNSNFRTKRIG